MQVLHSSCELNIEVDEWADFFINFGFLIHIIERDVRIFGKNTDFAHRLLGNAAGGKIGELIPIPADDDKWWSDEKFGK